MNVMVAEKAHYELGGFVQLSRRGVQHLISGIRWNGITETWTYALDDHDLWIPEAALDLVAVEYENERQTQAPAQPPAPKKGKGSALDGLAADEVAAGTYERTVESERERSARRRNEFVSRVCSAINYSSLENGSDTADYIIANFLADVLTAYDSALQQREKWYGRTVSGLR